MLWWVFALPGAPCSCLFDLPLSPLCFFQVSAQASHSWGGHPWPHYVRQHTHCHSWALYSALFASILLITTRYNKFIIYFVFWSLPYPLHLEQCQVYGKDSTHFCRMSDLLENEILSSYFITHDWSKHALIMECRVLEEGLLWKSTERYKRTFQSQHSPWKCNCSKRNVDFLNLHPLWLPQSLWLPAPKHAFCSYPLFLTFRILVKLPDGLMLTNSQAHTL